MTPQKFLLNSEEETVELAKKIASKLKKGDILTFSGDLGSGKTFLCREIIKALCGDDTNVISPTFNLLQIYQAPDFEIYHFDLYRLKHPHEIYELGIEDAFDKVCLIEWPEIISHILPKNNVIEIKISIINDNAREVVIGR